MKINKSAGLFFVITLIIFSCNEFVLMTPAQWSEKHPPHVDTTADFISIAEIMTPANGATDILLKDPLKIRFANSLDTSIKGSITFVNPTVTFQDGVNCAVTFESSSIVDDTVIMTPTDGYDTSNDVGVNYSAMTVQGFVSNDSYEMDQYINNGYNFTTIKRWDSWQDDDNGVFNYNDALEANKAMMQVSSNNLYLAFGEMNGGIQQFRVRHFNGTTWSWIDGGGADGLNINSGTHAQSCNLLMIGSNLYAGWGEDIGGFGQILINEYNGSSWNFINNSTSTVGLNYNPAQTASLHDLVTFEGLPVALFSEGSPQQLRIKQHSSGTTWDWLDGNNADGINYDLTKAAGLSNGVIYSGKLTVAWTELNTYSIPEINVMRVKQYDGGSSWSSIDSGNPDGLNDVTSDHAHIPRLIEYNNELYLFWLEADPQKLHGKKYNGSTWSNIDSVVLNHNINDVVGVLGNPVIHNNKLFFCWDEASGGISQIRLVSYDGTDWVFVDGDQATGINIDTSKNAVLPNLAVYNNRLIVMWGEESALSNFQIVGKVYNGL